MARRIVASKWTAVTAALVIGASSPATAQVEPAGFTRPTALPPLSEEAIVANAPAITFGQQQARVGDRVAQRVLTQLQVRSQITQAGQEANSSLTEVTRKQQRFVEVLEVEEGRVHKAHVSYPVSRMKTSEGEAEASETTQPVEKKSYLVTREGERLLVTDTQGMIPSQAEFELVVTSMQHLGLPNPLMDFLVGRTVQVGERLELPQEVAQQLSGLGDEFGEVKKFELLLKAIEQIDGRDCGVFQATIEAVGEPANPICVRAFGQVVLQVDTCRVVQANLEGPLTLATAEHTPAGSFQYLAQGTMRVAVQSQYGHARQ